MLFREVIGQTGVKAGLLKMAKENRAGHALLFTGREGTGKLALAFAYARYLNCTNRQGDDSCSECSSCRKYSKLVHPDLHLVFPVARNKKSEDSPVSDDFLALWREAVKTNPYLRIFMWYDIMGIENRQGSIGVSESALIIRKLSLKNFEATYKVMIIWMAEKMTIAAANKLLKILEEPPPNTIFMLIAEDTGTILPTILSRAQLIKLPGIDRRSMENALRDIHGITDPVRIDELARLADGNYLRLMETLGQTEDENNNFELFVRFMRLCFAVDIEGISSWIEDMASNGREMQKQFLLYALRIIRGNFIINSGVVDIDSLTDREKDFSSRFSRFIHTGNVFLICEELNKASIHIEYNGYSRLVFFDLALKIAKLLKISR